MPTAALHRTDARGSSGVRETVRRQREKYSHGAHRPLGSFLGLIGVYVSAVGAGIALAERRRVEVPQRPAPVDLALVSVATMRAARLVAKDSVTSPLRAPFTEYREAGGPGEVNEEVRGRGPRKAVGELLSCPFCVGQWVATGFVAGLVLAPRATRWVAATLAVSAGADALQFARAALEHAAE